MNNQWIKETNELISDWEEQYGALERKKEQIINELMDLKQRISVAHELISDYMKKHNDDSNSNNTVIGDLVKESYPQIIIKVAKQNNGILDVAKTAQLLADANMGTLDQIKHNIGNALWRYRKHFAQISKGKYRFTNHVQEANNTKDQNAPKSRVVTGIRDKVKEIKDKNPHASKEEVLNILKKSGFDFKGKNPEGSLNMAWVYWGFHKENRQQTLIGIN